MKSLYNVLSKKPPVFKQSDTMMWNDPHISKGMLQAHLNTTVDSATRNHAFVHESLNWISKIAPHNEYKKLLDLGCGPGIYAEEFYRKGYQVTGLDISKRSIQYAIESAMKKNMNINYIHEDYTNFSFSQHYNLITLIYCDFGVLSKAKRTLLLKKIYESLDENGMFIFDVFTKEKYKNCEDFKECKVETHGFWSEKSYVEFHAFYRYEEDSTFLNQHVIMNEDNITEYLIWEHVFTKEELKKDLQQAGFHIIEFYKDVCGNPCDKEDYTICVVAYK